MTILDVLTAPWAIEPTKLQELQAIYATHARGDKIDLAALEARLGRPLDNERQAYDVVDGVAILSLEGVIAKRMNLFSAISGGVSTQLVAKDLQAALDDPAVHSIILSIDSPGGTVDGTQVLADAVLAARNSKPIVAHASGMMASAAYWIGSAAQAIYIADGTTNVGSIGVVAAHTDISRAEEARGIKTTEVYAGAYKRVASQHAPLTEAGRASIQASVDYTYSLFVDAVAQQRGVSAEKVLSDMADGRVFMGQQAVDAGLVDGVMTLDALVRQLNDQRAAPGRSPSLPLSPKGSTMPMTREQLAAQEPDLLQTILAEGASGERARIQAVEAAAMPGHEALVAAMKFDGKSTGGDVALAVIGAERKLRGDQASKLASDAPLPVASAPAPTVVPPAPAPVSEMSRADLDKKAREYMAAHPGTTYVAAIKSIEQGA